MKKQNGTFVTPEEAYNRLVKIERKLGARHKLRKTDDDLEVRKSLLALDRAGKLPEDELVADWHEAYSAHLSYVRKADRAYVKRWKKGFKRNLGPESELYENLFNDVSPETIANLEKLRKRTDPEIEKVSIERRDRSSGEFDYVLYASSDIAICTESTNRRAKANAEYVVALLKAAPLLIARCKN